MQLTRWTPEYRPGYRHNYFPGFLDGFFTPVVRGNAARVETFVPFVDIYEKDDVIYFEAELPGFNKEDIAVDVQGKIITLKGERKVEESEGENRYRKERRHGRFERSFQLGFDADSNTIRAKYENGLLTLEVPKPADKQVKQIQIH